MDPFNDEAKKLIAKVSGDPAQAAIAFALISIADSLANLAWRFGESIEGDGYIRVVVDK